MRGRGPACSSFLLSWPEEPERGVGYAVQGPQWGEGLQGLDQYEQMLDTFTEQAKGYWRMWGPMGEPMVQGIDAWANMQRAYLQWVRQSLEAGRTN